MSTYRQLVVLFGVAMILLGITLIVVTLTHGFGVGVLLGVMFVAAGGGRLWLNRGRR